MTLYLLMKHPPETLNPRFFLRAGEIVKTSTDRAALQAEANQKNARRSRYFWRVRTVKAVI